MSFFKKKSGIIASIVTAVVLLGIVIVHFTGSNPVSNVLKTVFSPFQHGCAYIADKFDDGKDFILEMRAYKQENEELINQINILTKEAKDVQHYREENENLKGLLNLSESMEGYSTVAASVIAHSPDNWYDKIEINKGTAHGIAVGNAVMTPDGVVGKVTEAGLNWSVVSTVLNKDNSMGVSLTRTEDVALVEGDVELCMDGKCKMTFIDKGANVIVGDLLETSGSGGIYPRGISVGKITEVSADNMGKLNYAIVEPSVDFSKLYNVLVITGTN